MHDWLHSNVFASLNHATPPNSHQHRGRLWAKAKFASVYFDSVHIDANILRDVHQQATERCLRIASLGHGAWDRCPCRLPTNFAISGKLLFLTALSMRLSCPFPRNGDIERFSPDDQPL
jgi:hypothetical protein